MSVRQNAGRHRKDAGSPEAGRRPARDVAVSVGICAGCLLILVAIYGYIAAATTGRAIRYAWRWLGLRGRLKLGMSASLFAALAASGIDPGAWLAATMAGLGAFGVCGVWLVVAGVRGRRRWREHGGTVITGGAGSEDIRRNTERLDRLERRLGLLFEAMAETSAEAGYAAPDLDATGPVRWLTAVPSTGREAG